MTLSAVNTTLEEIQYDGAIIMVQSKWDCNLDAGQGARISGQFGAEHIPLFSDLALK